MTIEYQRYKEAYAVVLDEQDELADLYNQAQEQCETLKSELDINKQLGWDYQK